MARRTSAFSDLMEISARLPWPAALASALISYAGFHWIAARLAAPISANAVADIGPVYIHTMVATVASLLQFIVPLGIVIGASVSFVRRWRGAVLLSQAAEGGAAAIARLTWPDFEKVVGEAFRKEGYTVRGNLRGGPDGGVDLVLQKGSKRSLVQCKHWRSSSVGVTPVRELYGVMTARAADGGFVVTSGSFTREAQAFAEQCAIELVDGGRLRDWMATMNRSSGADPQRPPESSRANSGAGECESTNPACPHCGVGMVLRTARRGPLTGKAFWGCSRFPQCRVTLPA